MKTIMLTKLKSVTTVTVAIMAMIAIGLGLLACRTEAGRQTEGKPAEAVASQNPKPASGKPTDLQKLAGSWLAVSAKYKGDEVAKADREAIVMELVFTPGANGAGGTVARRAAGVSVEGKFIIDPDTVPKRIDFEKSPRLGVYELDGDTLRLCIPYTHTAYLQGIRPTSLDGKDADGLLIVLRRKEVSPDKDDKKQRGKPGRAEDANAAGVQIRSGLTGYVLKVDCTPGSKVTKGDVRLPLDPRPY
jgi:uncharacterized protein (TIGR03067 family)